MRTLMVRIRASAGQLTLLAVLTIVAGTLVIGAPRIANARTDAALRSTIGSLPYQVKDVTYRNHTSDPGALTPARAARRLQEQREVLDPALRDRIGDSWWAVTSSIDDSSATGTGLPAPARFGLRTGNGLTDAIRVVDGRLPQTPAGADAPVETVLTETSAKNLSQRTGSEFILNGTVRVRVVGIVAPLDEQAAVWQTEPLALSAYMPRTDGESYRAVLLSDVNGLARVAAVAPLTYEWRYRIDPATLDMAAAPALTEAALAARRQGIGAVSETGLDTSLNRFAENARAAQALLAVVQAGTLSTLIGLALLAAGLAVSRRRGEFALLRARGGSVLTIGARTLLESLPVIAPAALAGWALGRLAPGRPANTEAVLAAFAAVALLAVPVLSMYSLRRLSFGGEREDVSTAKVGLKRRTAELSLLVLAGLGVLLLRRRGLDPTTDIDLYLVTVPVLLAAGAAVVAVRAVPAPLGWAGRLAARTRGTVGFLGLARAGRAAPATIGPIAVLVVAVCTTVFSISVADTVQTGRDRATDHLIIGDATLNGAFFSPDTAQALAAQPGVTAVAQYADQPATDLLSSSEVGAARLGQVYMLMIDAPAFARVAAAADTQVDLPEVLTGATNTGAPPPALVSPQVAEDLQDHVTATADLQGRQYEFRMAGTITEFPTIPRTATRFIVLPLQALPVRPDKVIRPTGFLLAGKIDQAALTPLGDDSQRRWVNRIGTPTGGFVPVTTVTTWSEHRARLELTSLNGVLSFAYGVGALGGVALALLAVGFAVLAGARARGRVLSRLRTMGMDAAQGRRLLLVELAPLVSVAVLTGALAGVALPALFGPALSLSTFTDGYDAGVGLGPRTAITVAVGTLSLVVASLAAAVLVETLLNRRLRLGEVLRLGSFDGGEN